MAADSIFLRNQAGLTVLRPQPYDTQDVLQALLAQHPEVIAGISTTASGGAGDLVLVKREMGVPSAAGAGAIWSLDHLFLDAEAVPVVVEVKRSTDARIRREVVGQMLDYAANAVRYWPLEDIRKAFEQTAETSDAREERLPGRFGSGTDPDEFWTEVESNLRAGRIRMVFIADELPLELVRVIEFLNEQMNPTEVLGVEVRQYVGDEVGDERCLYVPRIVGRTAAAESAKSRPRAPEWSEEAFFDSAESSCPEEVTDGFRAVAEHTRSRLDGQVRPGRGRQPTIHGYIPWGSEKLQAWTMSANPTKPGFGIMFRWLYRNGAGVPEYRLHRFVERLRHLPGVNSTWKGVAESSWVYVNYVPAKELFSQPDATRQICDALDDMFADQE